MMAKRTFVNVPRAWTLLMVLSLALSVATAQALPGTWQVVVQNAGIASMHTQVTIFGTVVFLDRTDIGASQILLPNGECRDDPNDQVLTHDCTAHSVEFTPGPNTIRPLFILTDTWCSSGQVGSNGTLVQTGGDSDGNHVVRTFAPCAPGGTCDWVESTVLTLQAGRWYATNHILEDGVTQIIIGGISVYTMEFIPDNGRGQTTIQLLIDTNNFENDNLYPFVNLLPSGYLWIFANQDSIIYDYINKIVIQTLPTIPDGPRNYPSAGSSVMLPLTYSNNFSMVEVLVCGGAQLGAFTNPTEQLGALQSCGRMNLSSPTPVWTMENMPYRRTMGDMIMLPTKDVIIINGAQNGSQGWGFASNPTFNPLLYKPANVAGQRFSVLKPTTIPRVYHSTANLLPDGRILVAGSNTHQFYTFTGIFPTELRVEAFSPGYLSSGNARKRPSITTAPQSVTYGSAFTLIFTLATRPVKDLEVNMASAPFVTHSYAQGQRVLVLATTKPTSTGTANTYQVKVTAPPTASVAPPAYYMTFVVNGGIPSVAAWIQVSS